MAEGEGIEIRADSSPATAGLAAVANVTYVGPERNNVKLTPWLVCLTILVVTLVGPFTALKDVTPDDLHSSAYWYDLLAETVRSFSNAVLAAVTLVASVVGIPALRSANSR